MSPFINPFTVNNLGNLPRRVLIAVERNVAPKKFWNRRASYLGCTTDEPELKLLPILCRPTLAGLDVGAAAGAYSVQMLPWVSRCVAFEPRRWQAEYLRQLARYANLPITVEEVAVSNTQGQAVMRVPLKDQGLSTVEAGNNLLGSDRQATIAFNVATRTLDSYRDSVDVGFIKIDVEGHESAVLQGAELILKKDRPRLLIEVENRHRTGAIRDVFDAMSDHSYSGFFLQDRKLQPIANFDPLIHQRIADLYQPNYINNFVFVPQEESAAFGEAFAELFV